MEIPSLQKGLYTPNAVCTASEVFIFIDICYFVTLTSLDSKTKMTEVGQKVDIAEFEVKILGNPNAAVSAKKVY